MNNHEIRGFAYSIKALPSFIIIGFTKIVNSGGEMYDEIRHGDKWEILKKMNSKNKNVYGIASMDKECTEGKYRYTMGIEKNETYIEDKIYTDQLFSMTIKESDWVIFTMDFENDYGKFWGNDPYKMIGEIGYGFNNSVGLHIDVYNEYYDGHKMEFWLPAKQK
jgi:hypothetical protein